jgi:hypothetical protein
MGYITMKYRLDVTYNPIRRIGGGVKNCGIGSLYCRKKFIYFNLKKKKLSKKRNW